MVDLLEYSFTHSSRIVQVHNQLTIGVGVHFTGLTTKAPLGEHDNCVFASRQSSVAGDVVCTTVLAHVVVEEQFVVSIEDGSVD